MAPNTCKCCCYYIADITEGCVVIHIALVVRLYVYIYIDPYREEGDIFIY